MGVGWGGCEEGHICDRGWGGVRRARYVIGVGVV